MSISWPFLYKWQFDQSHKKLRMEIFIWGLLISQCSEMTHPQPYSTSLLPYHHHQNICKIRDDLSCDFFGISRIVLLFITFSVHSLRLPSPSLLFASFFFSFFFFLFLFSFLPFRATSMASGVFQASDQIGAAAAGLCHSHSNTGSKPCLRPTPQLTAMLDP